MRQARLVAFAGLAAGLLLFAASTVLLASLAAAARDVPITGSQTIQAGNATRLAYGVPVPGEPAVLDVAYAFPAGAGTLHVVGCQDQAWLARPGPPRHPILAQGPAASGEAHLAIDDLPLDLLFPHEAANGTPPAPAPPGRTLFQPFCNALIVAFTWQGDAGPPTVDLRMRTTPLEGDAAAAALAGAAAGLAIAAVFGVLGARPDRPPIAPAPEESTVESLLRVMDRTVVWLARARNHVLAAGVLGVLVWYPVLVPWAWRTGRGASASGSGAWLLSGLVVLGLLAATALWVGRLRALDHELRTWKERLEGMRAREAALLDDPEG